MAPMSLCLALLDSKAFAFYRRHNLQISGLRTLKLQCKHEMEVFHGYDRIHKYGIVQHVERDEGCE